MNALMELPLPEGGRKVVWQVVKAGRIQVPSGFLLLLDRGMSSYNLQF